ncbi:MAG: MBL fold metallo-hydrolase [Christensenellales bacterium]|jgi:hydroxyacylglutathione hydrolase
MKIKRLITGPLGVNTYIISSAGGSIVIDPGGNYDEIIKYAENVSAVLLTHGHFDHIGAVYDFYSRGVKVYIHYNDADKLSSGNIPALYYKIKLPGDIKPEFLNGDEILSLNGINIKVIHTPGHSAGSVIYIIDNNIFSGDTLFYNSYGRYDFSDGDYLTLKDSIIDKIFTLQGDYNIYPGHGEYTSLDYERKYNPILL